MSVLGVSGGTVWVFSLVAASAVFWLSILLSIGLWVARDARARGSDQPLVWGLAAALTPFGLPYYLYRRYRRAGLGSRAGTPRADRFLGTWASASGAAFLASALLAPPDPFAQLLYALGAFGLLLPAAYLLVYRGGYRRLGGLGGA